MAVTQAIPMTRHPYADGSTKKNAEQDAARQVLEYLGTAPVEPNGRTKRSEHAQ